MNDDEKRLAAAAAILEHPEVYMVCNGCGSIIQIVVLMKKRVACPSCDGYSFDTDPEHVKEQTQKLLVSGQQSVQKRDLS